MVKKIEDNVSSDISSVKDRWYIFRIQSGREEGMINALKNSFAMLARDGIKGEDYFTDFSAPKRTIVKYVDGKKVEKEVVAYPGYLFLKIRMTDEIILFLRRFFQMNGFGAILPQPITDAEYQKMIDGISGISEKAKDYTFAIGQRVMIKAGSFASMEGKVISINNDNRTLVVNVLIFGCETKVDVNFDQVELI
jgi:transcriptional antiterminator NusG